MQRVEGSSAAAAAAADCALRGMEDEADNVVGMTPWGDELEGGGQEWEELARSNSAGPRGGCSGPWT